MTDKNKPYMRAKEAAEYLGFKYRYLLELKDQGRIPFITIKRSILFAKDDLDQFMADQRVEARRPLRNH